MLPLVVQIEQTEENKARTSAFAHSPVRVGRNPLNDLQLIEAFVSQWHGIVRFDENGTYYLDLGSKNGTYVDGKLLPKNQEVAIEATTDLRIGTLRLHMLRGEAPPELIKVRRASAFHIAMSTPPPAVEGGTAFFSGTQQVAGDAPDASAEPGRDASSSGAAPGRTPPSVDPKATLFQGGSSIPAPPASQPAPAVAPPPPAVRPPVDQHRACYESYARARSELMSALRAEYAELAAAERPQWVQAIREQFPEVAEDPVFRELIGQSDVRPAGSSDEGFRVQDWLRRLTHGVSAAPGVDIGDPAQIMERVGAILEVFGQAFVELRRAQDEFNQEMALEPMREQTLLYATEDPHMLLMYLLDASAEGSQRVNELARAFAEFTLHQVALTSAVKEGARDLLKSIAPEQLEEMSEDEAYEVQEGLFSRVFSAQGARMWGRFLAAFENLTEEDRFTRPLFGKSFARAYYMITGGRASSTHH